MGEFRGKLEKSADTQGGWTLRADNGETYSLYFEGSPGKLPKAGSRVRLRGKLQKNMMGIDMGAVLKVDSVEKV